MKALDLTRIVVLLSLAGLMAACAGVEAPKKPVMPVTVSAEVTDTLARAVRLRDRIYVKAGSYVEVVYTFTPAEGFQPTDHPLSVMVHVTREDGTPVLVEDHYPPIPTTQWSAGKPVTYSDILRIPERIAVSRLSVRMGLVDPEPPHTRYQLLDAEGQPVRKPTVAKLFAQREELVQFVEGWNNLEFDASGRKTWRWMTAAGRILLHQPGRVGFVRLTGGTRLDCFPEPPNLTCRIGPGQPQVVPMVNERLDVTLPMGPEALDGEWVEIALSSDQTFTPRDCDGGDDGRSLAVMIEEVEFTGARYEEGWYGRESSDGKSWRWMGETGRATLGLPAGEGILVLNGRVPVEKLDAPPRIILELNGQVLDEFTPAGAILDRYYRLKRELLGEAVTVEVVLRTDRSFVPAEQDGGGDTRRLGLQVESLDVVPVPPREA